jgi:hypothetical protein
MSRSSFQALLRLKIAQTDLDDSIADEKYIVAALFLEDAHYEQHFMRAASD